MSVLDGKLAASGGKLSVIGSSYGGVSVNDCILNARKVADGIAAGRANITGLEAFRNGT
jgi:protoporphyrinogen oxidase